MGGYGILLIGVLVVFAVIALSSTIMAFATPVAGAIVVIGLCWLYLPAKPKKTEPLEPIKREPIPPDRAPRR